MKLIGRVLGYISFGEKWAGGICFLLLTLLMIADVSKREAVDKFLNWLIVTMQAYRMSDIEYIVGHWSVDIARGIQEGATDISNFFGRGGIIWAQKLSLYFMLWGGLFGSALASAKGSHLRPEIADKLLPKRILPYVKIMEQFVIASFFLFLAYLSVIYVKESISLDEVNPVTEIHLWIVQLIFPYIFISMGLRHLAYCFFPKLTPEDVNEGLEVMEELKEEIALAEQEGRNIKS